MSSDKYAIWEQYDDFADIAEQRLTTRRERRLRRPKSKHTPKVSEAAILSGIVEETAGLEGGFNPTYHPSRHEEGWLLNTLREFYVEGLITDVEAIIKGGKEANVYRCATRAGWAAAKVYRPHVLRQMRNDAIYRQGRATLTEEGREVRGNEHRIMRAIGKKTAFGVAVAHQSWLLHEYIALETLHAAGADVPQPLGVSGNAILMGYVGDESVAAPTLHSVTPGRTEAQTLFNRVVTNMELMLQAGLIHGDLSAYNILYWQGAITLIDFPQVVSADTNPQAQVLLQRDIQRVSDYFNRRGLAVNAEELADHLWQAYLAPNPDDVAADRSRWLTDAA